MKALILSCTKAFFLHYDGAGVNDRTKNSKIFPLFFWKMTDSFSAVFL